MRDSDTTWDVKIFVQGKTGIAADCMEIYHESHRLKDAWKVGDWGIQEGEGEVWVCENQLDAIQPSSPTASQPNPQADNQIDDSQCVDDSQCPGSP